MFCDVQYWPEILVQGFDAVAVTLHECGFLKPFNFFFFALILYKCNYSSDFTLGTHLELQGMGKRRGKIDAMHLQSWGGLGDLFLWR